MASELLACAPMHKCCILRAPLPDFDQELEGERAGLRQVEGPYLQLRTGRALEQLPVGARRARAPTLPRIHSLWAHASWGSLPQP